MGCKSGSRNRDYQLEGTSWTVCFSDNASSHPTETNQISYRYLGCDKYGILSANSTAISPEESFAVIPVPDSPSTFSIQTQREKFFTKDDSKKSGSEVRGDAETISFNTTFRIRMQARFKPKLKASKEEKALAKISRKELEDIIGRRLEDEEVRKLKKARREGNFHETALDMKVKSSHDKFAS
jgi:protein FRG1